MIRSNAMVRKLDGLGGIGGGLQRLTVLTMFVNGVPDVTNADPGDIITFEGGKVGLQTFSPVFSPSNAISQSTGGNYVIAPAASGLVTITGTGTRGEALDFALTVAAAPVSFLINAFTFANPGGGVKASFALDVDYTGAGTLVPTLAFKSAGGATLDTLTIAPFPKDGTPIEVSGLDAAAEDATSVQVTITDGTLTRTATTPVSGIDATPPYFVVSDPANGETLVQRTGSFFLDFDTPIVKGAGSVSLGALTVPLSACTVVGSNLQVPYSGLPASTAITPTWPAGLVTDASGNPCAALTNQITFTTDAAAAVTTLTHQYIGASTSRASGSGEPVGGDYTNPDAVLGVNGLLTGQHIILFPNTTGSGAGGPGTLQRNSPLTLATRLAGSHLAALGAEAFDLVLTSNASSGDIYRYSNVNYSSSTYAMEGFIGDVPSGAIVRTAVGSRATGVGAAVSVDIQVDAGGYILASMQSDSAVGPITWTGIDKTAESAGSAAKFRSSASRSFATSGLKTVTVTGPSTNALAVVLVSVSPAP